MKEGGENPPFVIAHWIILSLKLTPGPRTQATVGKYLLQKLGPPYSWKGGECVGYSEGGGGGTGRGILVSGQQHDVVVENESKRTMKRQGGKCRAMRFKHFKVLEHAITELDQLAHK